MQSEKYFKIGIIGILYIALAVIGLAIENDWKAIYGFLVIIFVLILYFIIRIWKRKRLVYNILRQNNRFLAKIISLKVSRGNKMVLQLLVQNQEQNYISSLIIDKPGETEITQYSVGTTVDVYIDPQNKHRIYIPDLRVKVHREIGFAPFLSIILFVIVPIIVAILYDQGYLSKTPVYFQDSEIVKHDSQPYYLELSQSSGQFLIDVYNPLNNKKITSIIEKPDYPINSNTRLSLSHQENMIFVIGDWYTPVIEAYDISSLQKIMNKKEFEAINPFFNDEIVSLNKYRNKELKFKKEDIFEFNTKNKHKYFFSISSGKYFESEKKLEEYIFQTDSTLMAEHLYSFALLKDSASDDKFQICIIEAQTTRDINELIYQAGRNGIVYKDFLWETLAYKDKSKPVLRAISNYFYNAKIAYFDFDIVVIEHQEKEKDHINYLISGINKDGKQIFSIDQSSFPNLKEMQKEIFLVKEHFYHKTIRDKNYLIITFSSYGGICVDLKTGKLVWKFET